jgi:alpha-tubulin suppressor-like RCC1 family protein
LTASGAVYDAAMRWLPVVCAIVGLACEETPATQVLVRFFAEPTLVRDATAIRVTVLDAGGNDVVKTRELQMIADTLLATVPVTPSGGDGSRTFRVEAELLGTAGTIARKLVIGRYTADELREVNVWFEESCRDALDCADGRTCDLGVCTGACFEPSPIGGVERHHPTCSTCQDCRAASCLALPDGMTPEERSCGCPADRCTSGACATDRASDLAVSGGTTAGSVYGHACAISDNQVYCWGSNRTAQAGGDANLVAPEPLMGDFNAESIAAGRDHSCGLGIVDGARFCWGHNGHLLLTDDAGLERSPVPIEGPPGEPQFTDIASGWFMSVALADGGGVYTWGAGANWVLGRADVDVALPYPIEGTDWTAIAAGGLHGAGLRGEGELWCWGWNDDGECGVGHQDELVVAARTGCVGDTCFSDFKAVGAGEWHTCAIRASGQMLCAGQNDNGALGIGPDTVGNDVPEWRPLEGSWRAADGGEDHTCAIDDDGSLFCWGGNAQGQLGLGDFMPRDVPARVALPGGGTVAVIETGYENSCAVRHEDGAVFCWGANYTGQVGNGMAGPVGVPLPSRVCF